MKAHFKKCFLLLFLMALGGCKISIVVPEGGKVVSESGSIDCRQGQNCLVEVADTTFNQTLTAVPDHGWEFLGWLEGGNMLCASSGTNPCLLTTTGYPGNTGLMTVLASDATYFVIPKFKKLNVDLDEDGVINELDSDDDNDGVPDIEDNFPHDPTDGVRDLTLGGTLTEDTVLTDQGAPYILAYTLTVPAGITLTIEKGVTIEPERLVGGQGIKVFGTVVVAGSADANVTLKDIFIRSVDPENMVYDERGQYEVRIEHAKVLNSVLQAEVLILKYSDFQSSSSFVKIHNSSKGDSYVEFNTFRDTNSGLLFIGGADDGTSNVHINHNAFSRFGVYVNTPSSTGITELTYNTFTNAVKQGGLDLGDLDLPRYVGTADQGSVSAINNYWGTTATSVIESLIYDANDDSGVYAKTIIEYLPILEIPHPDTPSI